MNQEKAIRACAALYFGKTEAEASLEAGITISTLRKWRKNPEWSLVEEQVAANEVEIFSRMARKVVINKLQKDCGQTARWVLERRDKHFAPPTKQVEVKGHVEHEHHRRALQAIPTHLLEAAVSDEDEEIVDAFFEEVDNDRDSD